MKLMYVITRSEHGGAQTHVLDLLRSQDPQSCVLVSGNHGYLLDAAKALGIEVHVVPALSNTPNPIKDVQATLSLIRLIKLTRPKLVHAHSTKAGLVVRLAAYLTGIPCVFTAHGWAFTEGVAPTKRRLAQALEKALSRITTAFITVSNYDKELGIRELGIDPSRITTIHNGISALGRPELRGNRGDPSRPVKIIMVARFSVQKSQGDLLKAFSGVKGAELLLVGDGELLDEVKTLAHRLGLDGRVQFLGSRNDVPDLLADADIFALISEYEGLPISILEAMRAGLPVVASNVGGVSETVFDGVNGYLIARGDVLRLRLRLQELVDEVQLRQQLGEQGRKLFLSDFTLEAMVDATSEVYRLATEGSLPAHGGSR